MIKIKKEFLDRLHYLSILKNQLEFGFSNAERLYSSVYELGRHTYIYPDYRELFTVEDIKIFKEFFPTSLCKLIGHTPSLVNTIDKSDINISRERRSQLWFLKNEILDMYEEFNGDLTLEIEESLKKLEVFDNILQTNVSIKDYDIQNNLDDIPNLTGVPDSHYWWTEKHRAHRN